MTSDDLKSCPFCGGKAMFTEIIYKKTIEIGVVVCTNCGAMGPFTPDIDEKCEGKAWNKREKIS